MSHDHKATAEREHACAHQAEVLEIGPVKRKLKVSVPAEEVRQEYDKVLREVGKVASIKGFRAGKVPRAMLEKFYGPEIEKETAESLLKHSLGHAFADLKLTPVSQPELTDLHFKLGEAFRYEATFEIKPQIELAPYKGLALQRPSAEVSEAQVEEQIERLRNIQAVLKPRLAGAEIAKGDYVTLDLNGRIGGSAHPKLKADGQVLVAGEEMIYPEIDRALIGKKEGDAFTCNLTLPAQIEDQELAGKAAEISVLVRTIKQKVLPELNDAFVAQLGGEAKTVEELRQRIRQDLTHQAQQTAEEKLREEALCKLAEANPFALPESLVEREMHYLMGRTMQRMQMSGMKVEAEAFRDPKTLEKFRHGAEANIRRELLLERIAEMEKLEVSDDDVRQELLRLANEAGLSAEELKKLTGNEGSREELRGKIRNKKSLDFILGQAKIS